MVFILFMLLTTNPFHWGGGWGLIGGWGGWGGGWEGFRLGAGAGGGS